MSSQHWSVRAYRFRWTGEFVTAINANVVRWAHAFALARLCNGVSWEAFPVNLLVSSVGPLAPTNDEAPIVFPVAGIHELRGPKLFTNIVIQFGRRGVHPQRPVPLELRAPTEPTTPTAPNGWRLSLYHFADWRSIES